MKKSEKPETEQVKSVNLSYIKSEMVKVKELSIQLKDDQKSFIRGLVNPDLKDTELLMFLSFANKLQLNPFTKEVIAIVYNGNDPKKRTVSTVITRDGKRTVAQRTNELDEIISEAIYVKEKTTPIYEINPDTGVTQIKKDEQPVKETVRVEAWNGGTLWGATATVTRKGKKFTVTVPFSEYTTGYNLWKSKPSTMIKKVAESQALSAAFPEILSGVYDETEMPQPEIIKTLPASPDDEKSATEQQIDTIKALNPEYVIPDNFTFGEAKKLILEFSQKPHPVLRTQKGDK